MAIIQQTVGRYYSYATQAIDWNSIVEWYGRSLDKTTLAISKSSKGKRITIGVAIGLTVLYSIYDRVAKPPRRLRHIPYINSLTFNRRFIIDKWPTAKLSQELAMPLLKDSPMYLRNDKLGWTVHVCAPEPAKQVFMKLDLFPKASQKSFSGTIIYRLVGISNIIFESGDEWKKHRKLTNPAFHRSMPIKLFGDTAQQLFTLLDKTEQNEFTVDIGDIFERLTLSVIGKAGFGFDFDCIKNKDSHWKLVYDTVMNGHRDPLFGLFPILEKRFLWMFPKRRRIHETTTEFLGMMQQVIEHKRRYLKENTNLIDTMDDAEKDLLTLMLEGEIRGEGVLTDKELLNDICVFFIAGHDTTSTALTACCYYLAKHPEYQQRAREEVNRILCPADLHVDVLPTNDQTREFVFLNQLIRETLRMNGSVVSLVSPRKTTKDAVLSGVPIPKGTLVNVNIYDLHHNPAVWDDPEVFNPDRFSAEAEADQKAGGGMSWVPFSNGSRICIGQNFSLAEQRVILACLLRKYEWELPEGSLHKDGLVTSNSNLMFPQNVQIRFRRRY